MVFRERGISNSCRGRRTPPWLGHHTCLHEWSWPQAHLGPPPTHRGPSGLSRAGLPEEPVRPKEPSGYSTQSRTRRSSGRGEAGAAVLMVLVEHGAQTTSSQRSSPSPPANTLLDPVGTGLQSRRGHPPKKNHWPGPFSNLREHVCHKHTCDTCSQGDNEVVARLPPVLWTEAKVTYAYLKIITWKWLSVGNKSTNESN